jgi:prepilin-type N-terminal cleavage/methylation domain-containing protein
MRDRKSAFTLIEMVAASAIAALLMAGAFAVMTTMIHDRERMKASALPGKQQTSAILEIFRNDLVTASTYAADKNKLTLQNCHLLNKSMVSTDRPVEVVYHVVRGQDGESYFVRRQRTLDDPAVPRPTSELLAIGILNWTIEPLLDEMAPRSASGAGQNALPLPRRFRLEVRFEDARKNIDQVICLR